MSDSNSNSNSESNSNKTRIFEYAGNTYQDPNPALSNEAVRDMLAATFPMLSGGKIKVEDDGKNMVVTFTDRPQHKG